jgi:dihydroorotate dehydrogenase (fumarate)
MSITENKYNIGDIEFSTPIMNASGCWVLNEEQITDIYNSELGGIIAKTCTIFSKEGNQEPNYYEKDGIHFNSKGLPNMGYQYYRNLSKKIVNKPYIISIAFENYEKLKTILQDYDEFVDKNMLVEINLSCPNLENEIPGYYCDFVEDLLDFIRKLGLKKIKIGLKFPPFLQKIGIIEMSKILNKYTYVVKYIVSANSIPNCVALNNTQPCLHNVYGGMSGKLNKPIALSNVIQFSKLLDKNIKIVGCGGIENLQDVVDYLSNGANFVQIASCFYDYKKDILNKDKINELVKLYKTICVI